MSEKIKTKNNEIKKIIQENEKKELEKKIILKIQENIKAKKSELEIINSEMYLLKTKTEEQETKEYLIEEQKQINKLLKKIEEIKNQLKIYSKDKVLEDAIYLDNKNVLDDIIDYKKMIEAKSSLKEEYELIEEYGILMEEIDKVNDRCIELEKDKNTQLLLLEMTDEEINELEINALKEDESITSLNDLVSEQISIINDLDKQVGIIDTEKEILYNYDMLKKLMKLELKYMAIMSLSPLKGTIPHIAISAQQTKDAINLILAGPLVTTEEKINYIAKDYTNEIENMEYKLNDIEDMLNNSLYSINNFKEKIKSNENFKNNSKYDYLITKMENMEEYIKDNNSRLEIYKIRLNKNRTKNKETLAKVLKLNKKD